SSPRASSGECVKRLGPTISRSATGLLKGWRSSFEEFATMGRTRTPRELAVQLQPRLDRLSSQKVAQAYQLLVPVATQPLGGSVSQPTSDYEQISRDLCTSVLGPSERG